MLYKVTPNLTPQPVEKKAPVDPNAPKVPRKRRKSAVYDADGNEVLITMMCLKCKGMKPLAMFGLRKMADGAIRNQPWCRTCRSGAGAKKPADAAVAAAVDAHTADAHEAEGTETVETSVSSETVSSETEAPLAVAATEPAPA